MPPGWLRPTLNKPHPLLSGFLLSGNPRRSRIRLFIPCLSRGGGWGATTSPKSPRSLDWRPALSDQALAAGRCWSAPDRHSPQTPVAGASLVPALPFLHVSCTNEQRRVFSCSPSFSRKDTLLPICFGALLFLFNREPWIWLRGSSQRPSSFFFSTRRLLHWVGVPKLRVACPATPCGHVSGFQ